MRLSIVIVLCIVGIANAQPVDPAIKARADAAFAEGNKAYNANDFTTAALKFEDAYRLVADPAYLFNIGQAYRQAKDCVKAAAAFAKFVELVPAAPNIANARALLAEVNVCALFVEGRRLMSAGRPAEACDKFAAAHKEDPSAVGTLLNLGLCNEQIGKLASAADWFRKAKSKGEVAKAHEAVQEAKQHLDGIASKIPKVDIVVTPAAKATIQIDDTPITTLIAIEIDPGRHTVNVEAPGKVPATKTFEIGISETKKVSIELVAVATPAPPSNRLAYILGGAGLTLWAGTAVLGILAKREYDEAGTFDEQDKWKSIVRYGGTSMFVIGTAAVTTSIILYIRNREERRELDAGVLPYVAPNEVGVTFGRSF